MDVVYLHEGSFDGLLCCVFEAYEKNETPAAILPEAGAQLMLGCAVRHIETDAVKALRVHSAILRDMGERALERVFYVSRYHGRETGRLVLDYVRLGFINGGRIVSMLADPTVWRVEEIAKKVSWEVERHIQFLRFGELENGAYFAEFEPESDVLPLVMPHFAERFNVQPFLILDKRRLQAGLFDTREWFIMDASGMTPPDYSPGEKACRQMWRAFYEAIAIKERASARRHRGMMPKKFWKHMTEKRAD